jgi:hypothetical protein
LTIKFTQATSTRLRELAEGKTAPLSDSQRFLEIFDFRFLIFDWNEFWLRGSCPSIKNPKSQI